MRVVFVQLSRASSFSRSSYSLKKKKKNAKEQRKKERKSRKTHWPFNIQEKINSMFTDLKEKAVNHHLLLPLPPNLPLVQDNDTMQNVQRCQGDLHLLLLLLLLMSLVFFLCLFLLLSYLLSVFSLVTAVTVIAAVAKPLLIRFGGKQT